MRFIDIRVYLRSLPYGLGSQQTSCFPRQALRFLEKVHESVSVDLSAVSPYLQPQNLARSIRLVTAVVRTKMTIPTFANSMNVIFTPLA